MEAVKCGCRICILKAHELDVGCERKGGVKNDFKIFD